MEERIGRWAGPVLTHRDLARYGEDRKEYYKG
jgi:hypothetical protein